jgi:hypothetical protein
MSQPKFQIVQHDMGGWVRICLGKGETTAIELALFLSHSLTDWMRKRPQLRVRNIVPIQIGGNTMELHAWYDQVHFPDLKARCWNEKRLTTTGIQSECSR